MSRTTTTLTTARRFIAVAGGIMLFLAPRDAQMLMQTPLRELYILSIAVFVTAVMLLLFKSYEPLGASLVTVMVLSSLQLLWSILSQLLKTIREGTPFSIQPDYYNMVCMGAVWLVPFLIGMLIRLLARNEWDTRAKREDFCRFFRSASAAFSVYYFLVFVICFLFIRRIDLMGVRDYNLIPFAQILDYFHGHPNAARLLLGNLFFFAPIGYFLMVYYPKKRWWELLIFILCLSGGIELIQFVLNCGMADIDDVILNSAGFLFGVGFKHLLDRVRRVMTDGEERSIQYIESE